MSGQETRIDVTPARLEEVASMFYAASRDTVTLLEDQTRQAQQLIDDMHTELRHSPDALYRLCYRWRDATSSLANALEQVAKNLNSAAATITRTDREVMP
jgi:uncharacterized protein YukE